MAQYIRAVRPGGSFFFTVNLATRGSPLLVERIFDLRVAYLRTIATMPVQCDAMVVMPDHIHAVWTLPPGDTAYSERWRRIKHRFTRAVGAPPSARHSHLRKREAGVWQRRFWEHRIRDMEDYRHHVEYCLWNPVRHGLVTRPEAWPYSSIHRDNRNRELR